MTKILTNHRFNYLFKEFGKLGSVGNTPIPKTTIIQYPNYNIIMDMTDGIIDEFNFKETVGILYSYLDLFPNKKYFYVKVNYSPICSSNLDLLASETNGIVLTCGKFSLYPTGASLFNNRKELRKGITLKNKVEYSGRDHGKYHMPEDYNGSRKFKYPVSWREAKDYLGLGDSSTNGWKELNFTDRNQQVKNIEEKLGDLFSNLGHVNKDRYVKSIRDGNIQYQPFGTSIRHSTWESMILGVPSLMSPSSYISEDMKDLIVFDDVSKEEIMEKISTISKEQVIDYFESNMTPEKILQNLFKKIQELL